MQTKFSILAFVFTSGFALAAFANSETEILRAGMSAVVKDAIEEENSGVGNIIEEVNSARSSGKMAQTFETDTPRGKELTIVHTSNNGQTANVKGLLTWSNNSGAEQLSFRLPKSPYQISDLKIESADLASVKGNADIAINRSAHTPLGDVQIHSTYHVPNETTADYTLRSQSHYGMDVSFSHTKFEIQRRNTGLWYTKQSPDLHGNMTTLTTSMKDSFPEGRAEAFEVNPQTGNTTLYTTDDTAQGGAVYAREVTVSPSPSGTSGSATVKYGEPRKLTAKEIQDSGIFSVKSGTVNARRATAKPAGSLQINDSPGTP